METRWLHCSYHTNPSSFTSYILPLRSCHIDVTLTSWFILYILA